ncbi:MAG TPA: histidine kinase, partial [Gammaproteobacteria bacterium]|nr:histidine kinase [Gammaproteobacteria bacterium]
NLSQIPIILYMARELTSTENQCLQESENNLTIKVVRSQERLLDEATLFLHQLEANLSPYKRKMLKMVHDKEAILRHKKVLIVDDDMRNTFALLTLLEDKEVEVFVAENGKEALEMLEQHPDTHLVLMDIMMPEMDGYETMQNIRKQFRFRQLPLIALTAKAMPGDKAKCIEAGANDYLSKPVDTDKLISLMRVWLYQ